MRSNLHTGQYAGSVPSDSSKSQVLVEALLLLEVTRCCTYKQVSLYAVATEPSMDL